MGTTIAAWLMVLMADNSIPSGDLTVHPLSERAVLRRPGRPVQYFPDRRVDLALTSYALPTRSIGIDGDLRPVACRFTLRIEDGTTNAVVDELGDVTACGMGDLTASVVETLGRWRFEIEHEPKKKLDRYGLDVGVQFGAGESTATVDIEQVFLASRMPTTPFEGLRIVRSVTPSLRVVPSFISRSFPDAQCALHLWIDAKGVPTDVGVEECSDSVREEVLAAAWRWRFEPELVNGVPIDSEFDLMIYVRGRSAH